MLSYSNGDVVGSEALANCLKGAGEKEGRKGLAD